VVPAYDGVCTEFFGFNTALELRYRGRLDASRTALVTNARRELFGAMCRIAETRTGPAEQQLSMGCSIAWPIYAAAVVDGKMAGETNRVGGLNVDGGHLGDVRERSY
jgi:hypothetical protein